MEGLMETFWKGGPLMWPLLACSLLSLTITVERAIFWIRMKSGEDWRVIDRIFSATEKGDFAAAARLDGPVKGATARVLLSGLAHRDYGLNESLEVAAGDEIERMKHGLSVLDTIITMAPLLGILGTVTGIIQSFDVLGSGEIRDPRVMGGISEALITTASGLTIALVTLLPFKYFVRKVEQSTKRMEQVATQFEVAYKRGLDNANNRDHAA